MSIIVEKLNSNLGKAGNIVIRDGEEPAWMINNKLERAIYEKMPFDLFIEEKAIYIYGRLCQELSYDEGYFYRTRIKNERYSHTFSKERLEDIVPGSKITCWDFARVFAKLVNNIDRSIKAAILSNGGKAGHYFTGVYTENILLRVEAINSENGINDLTRAKDNIKFGGIEVILGEKEVLDKAINRVYSEIYPKKQITIDEYLRELKQFIAEDIPDDCEGKLKIFIDVMKGKKIFGNEAIQNFNAFWKLGFFGDKTEKALLGREEIKNGRRTFRRMVLIREKSEGKGGTKYYLLDSDYLELFKTTDQKIIKLLNNGKLIYENNQHKIEGIDYGED